jgi:hypothetical protein
VWSTDTIKEMFAKIKIAFEGKNRNELLVSAQQHF